MIRRLNHHRALLAVVLVTAFFVAAITGVGVVPRQSTSGMHVPDASEHFARHTTGDIRSAVAPRPANAESASGPAFAYRIVVGHFSASLSGQQVSGDWRKVDSGLVPLPLRI